MKRISFAGRFIVLTTVLFAVMAAQAYALDDKYEDIESLIKEMADKSNAPGMSAVVLNNGEVEYLSYGYSDKKLKTKAAEDTLYELAGLSKAFTGLGIFYLEDKGLLSLDDPIDKYLPWLEFSFSDKVKYQGDIKIRHFLGHNTGLTNDKHLSLVLGADSDRTLESTVRGLTENITDILEDRPVEPYKHSGFLILDIVFSALSIAAFLVSFLFSFIIIRKFRMIKSGTVQYTGLLSGRIKPVFWSFAITVVTVIIALKLPSFWGHTWYTAMLLLPWSMISVAVLFPLVSILVFMHILMINSVNQK